METQSNPVHHQVISAFQEEFSFIKDKFEIMNLLPKGVHMNEKEIEEIKLPSPENNMVWHPGVYVFIANDKVYRVGVSINNSRARVLQHLKACTHYNSHQVWHLNKHEDRAILLFNVKNSSDRHWLLALEVFLETKFLPLIPAKRKG